MGQMGLNFGLESSTRCLKRKFRWIFTIPQVSASGVNSLPPSRAARPNLNFKEIEVQHANETVYLPGKPDWKPINLLLYDTSLPSYHPVFEWLRYLYDPTNDSMYRGASSVMRTADLTMLSGDGTIIESWVFENVWPQGIDFQDLDMGNSEVCACDITLRFARAYLVQGNVGESFQGSLGNSGSGGGSWGSPGASPGAGLYGGGGSGGGGANGANGGNVSGGALPPRGGIFGGGALRPGGGTTTVTQGGGALPSLPPSGGVPPFIPRR